MTAGRDAGAIGAVDGVPEAPPDDTGEALGLPPSGADADRRLRADAVRDADGVDRFGLAARRPAGAGRAAALPRRRAATRRSRGGDLCVQACANDPQVAVHADPQPGPDRRRAWSACAGRSSASAGRRRRSPAQATPRNLFGLQGRHRATSRPRRPTLLRDHLWVAAGRRTGLDGRRLLPGHPQDPDAHRDLGPHVARRAGGDRRPDQGRRRAARARPASSTQLDFAASGADGEPRSREIAHVRLAHPTNNGGARLLRRGYNFVDGSDGLGPAERRPVLHRLPARPATGSSCRCSASWPGTT